MGTFFFFGMHSLLAFKGVVGSCIRNVQVIIMTLH